jgi:hypothetical protein
MLKLFIVIVLTILFVSCGTTEDLEKVVNNSRYNVSAHGDDLYWKGKKVGTWRKVYGKNQFYENLLIQKNLWILKTGRKYWAPDKSFSQFSTKISMIYDIYTPDGKHRYTCFNMVVPVSLFSAATVSHYFVYDVQDGKITKVSKSAGNIFSGSEFITSEAEKIFASSGPYIPFEEQKLKTLQNESVYRVSRSYFAYLESRFNYRDWNMKQESPKGARSKIKSDVQPIGLLQVRGGFAIFKSFFTFDYESDMGYNGGSVDTGKSARDQFSLNENASYLLKLAAGTKGIEVNFLIENFQFGNYEYTYSSDVENPEHDLFQERAFETKRRHIEILYHPAWRDIARLGGTERKSKIIDTYFGYRYMTFKSPKIFYSYISYKEDDDYGEVTAESTPQFVETKAHALGTGFNNHMVSMNKGFHLLYGFEFFAGYAQCEMIKNDYYEDGIITIDQNGTLTKLTYPFVDVGVSLGFSMNNDFGNVHTSLFVNYKVNAYFEFYKMIEPDNKYTPETDQLSNTTNIFSVITAGANIYW